MRITILGGWGEDLKGEWGLHQGEREEFTQTCLALGRELARRKQVIIVGDDSPDSADCHIVKGMLEVVDTDPGARIEVIEVANPAVERRLFQEDWRKYGGTLFTHHSFSEVSSESASAKIISVGKADAVLTIAGLRRTYDAGLSALVARKKLVPIGSFGGASRKLIDALTSGKFGEVENSVELESLNGVWTPDLMDNVLSSLGITKSGKPHAFIGSSSEGLEVAKQLQLLLSNDLEVEIWNQGTVFGLGTATLEALEQAVLAYDIGIFIFTPDDELHTRGVVKPVARDNVIFELGLFTGRLTRWRAFVVHPSNKAIELPTDLSGITTAPYDADKDLNVALKSVSEQILRAVRKWQGLA